MMSNSHTLSSGHCDHRAANPLTLGTDCLNPAILAAILNRGQPSPYAVAPMSLQQNEFFLDSSILNNVASRNRELCSALSIDPLAHNSNPYTAIALSRGQQQISNFLARDSPDFSSSEVTRWKGLFESRQSDVLSAGQLESHYQNLLNTVQSEVRVSEAYQRGRDEAIMSLLRAGNVNPTTTAPVEQPLPPANIRRGTVDDLVSPKDSNTKALETLGNDATRKLNPYFDASSLDDPDEVTLCNRRTRGGVTEPFPEKLHRMLRDAVENGTTDIISFYPHGRAFGIHSSERFCREIMPKYFKQSRLSSFQRQLNIYGFQRISSGPDFGGYFHELFLQGRPALAIHMRRVGVSSRGVVKASARTGKTNVPFGASPDFYSIPPVKECDVVRSRKV